MKRIKKISTTFENFVISDKFFRIFFVLIIIIAIFLRLNDIKNLPCGLAPDEADNARYASIGKIQAVYNNQNNEVEGFFISTLVIIYKLLGPGVWQTYFASSLIGILTIVIAGLAIKKHFGNFISLISTILISTSIWHIALSQSGTRIVTTPFFISLLLLSYPKTQKNTLTNPQLIFFGISLALGFYGYLAYRIILILIPVAIILFIFKNIILNKQKLNDVSKYLVFVTAFVITLIPLILGYIKFPNVILTRTFQTIVVNNNLKSSVENVVSNVFFVINGFTFKGGQNWHHTLDQKSFIPIFAFPFLIVGIYYCIRQTLDYITNRKNTNLLYALLAPSFFIFLLPDLLTNAVPHGGRLGGEIPIIFIIISIGLLNFLENMRIKHSFNRIILPSMLIVMLTYLTFNSLNTLNRRLVSKYYAIDYFCEMKDVGKYLTTNKFQDFINYRRINNPQIIFIGSWYDMVPIEYYLSVVSPIKGEATYPYPFKVISIDDIEKINSYEPNIIILPSFITYDFKRIPTWSTNIPGENISVFDKILQYFPNSKIDLFNNYNPNSYWYPDNISFKVISIK